MKDKIIQSIETGFKSIQSLIEKMVNTSNEVQTKDLLKAEILNRFKHHQKNVFLLEDKYNFIHPRYNSFCNYDEFKNIILSL